MNLDTVTLESLRKFAGVEAEIGDLSIPEETVRFEDPSRPLKAWIVYVDFTNSTHYFKEQESYTGFVIFNTFIMLLKTYIRHF